MGQVPDKRWTCVDLALGWEMYSVAVTGSGAVGITQEHVQEQEQCGHGVPLR